MNGANIRNSYIRTKFVISFPFMKCVIKNLPKSQAELIITVDTEECKPLVEKAARRMSEQSKIEGFRPGHAPYEIVKARFGEHAILEEAAEDIVKKNFFAAVKENKLETIGQPKIEIVKMAASNPFEFKATVAIVPEIKLGAYKNLGVKKQTTGVTDEKVESVLSDLAKMRSKEILTDKPATAKDKVLVDMEMTKDGVAIEGGATKNMTVYLAEKHYIPGFNEELAGVKKGDEKTFSLDFPKEHYQKNLAGAKVDFKVKINDVYEIQPPEINDEFAKSAGQKTLADLRALIRKNLKTEAVSKDDEKFEIEVLTKIVEASKFGDIPEVLINEETHRMVHELEHNVEAQGMKFEDYLKSVKKDEKELMLEFAPEAVKRIKIALVVREVGKIENIKATDKEIMEEITKLMNAYKDNADAQKQISQPDYADYIRTRIENKKAIDIIKQNN